MEKTDAGLQKVLYQEYLKKYNFILLRIIHYNTTINAYNNIQTLNRPIIIAKVASRITEKTMLLALLHISSM